MECSPHEGITEEAFETKHPGETGTSYHQDSNEETDPDREGELQFWLALAPVAPEMGALRFLSGSHRQGPRGPEWNPVPEQMLAELP
eukprot:COSAG06_NODE_58389_length_277_cov_0.584270_1_plen_86_part_01